MFKGFEDSVQAVVFWCKYNVLCVIVVIIIVFCYFVQKGVFV